MPRYVITFGHGESAAEKARSREAKRKAAQQAKSSAKKAGKRKPTIQRTASGAVGGSVKKIKDYMVTHSCSANEAKRRLGLKHAVVKKRKTKGGFTP